MQNHLYSISSLNHYLSSTVNTLSVLEYDLVLPGVEKCRIELFFILTNHKLNIKHPFKSEFHIYLYKHSKTNNVEPD